MPACGSGARPRRCGSIPASNRVTGAIRVPDDTIKGFALDGGEIWIATEGSRLLRFDARTGERTASSAAAR